MLAQMNSQPALIAYDRPSEKLIGFLGKHFNLRSHVRQNNNYVVFDDYYTTVENSKETGANPQSDVRQSTTGYDNSSAFG